MRILMCNSYYYIRGGAERCFFDLTTLLEQHGHEVVPFSMQHERNYPTPYDKYFLSNIDFPQMLAKGGGLIDKLKTAERVIYSREARQKIERLIEDTQPDIAHIHGIAHETSPSILPAIKAAGIPVVQTLHDYKLLCPNTSFVSNGQICERCKVHRYYNAIRYRCKRGSLGASFLASMELYIHKAFQVYERNVDAFIAPSNFLANKMREYGVQNYLVQIPNFIDVDSFECRYTFENYVVYVGRLDRLKGIQTLLEAMLDVRRSHLYIAGSGDAMVETELRTFVKEHKLDNVTFLGHLDRSELLPLVQHAACVIVPSQSYENYPMSALEALASGTPVIGARIGGIPEIVIDGETGLLFESGNAESLSDSINILLDDPNRVVQMGRNGRRRVEEINHPDRHYAQTMALYTGLLASGATPAIKPQK